MNEYYDLIPNMVVEQLKCEVAPHLCSDGEKWMVKNNCEIHKRVKLSDVSFDVVYKENNVVFIDPLVKPAFRFATDDFLQMLYYSDPMSVSLESKRDATNRYEFRKLTALSRGHRLARLFHPTMLSVLYDALHEATPDFSDLGLSQKPQDHVYVMADGDQKKWGEFDPKKSMVRSIVAADV